jgi:GTP pyrophosphokinase
MTATPLVADTPVVQRALTLIEDAYRTRVTRTGRTTEHPLLVGILLAADEQPAAVVAAGLLHDVLEDTAVTEAELSDGFTVEIVGAVQALTEDPSVANYAKRKAALRRRILDAGRAPATISIADKLAKLRVTSGRPASRKLAHYRATLQGVDGRYGPGRLSDRLRDELARWTEP